MVELLRCGDELRTDPDSLRAAIDRVGADEVAAVVTTTSCFAPRAADDLPVRQFELKKKRKMPVLFLFTNVLESSQ